MVKHPALVGSEGDHLSHQALGGMVFMHWRLSAFLAWRYLFRRQTHGVAAVFSWIASVGIALGVAILITVLSVMNGFEKQIHAYFFNEQPHVTVESWHDYWSPKESPWQDAMRTIQNVAHVESASAYLEGQGLLMAHQRTQGMIVRGVEPQAEHIINSPIRYLNQASLNQWQETPYGIVMTRGMADEMKLHVGMQAWVIIPKMRAGLLAMMPVYHRVTVMAVVDQQTQDMADHTLWMRLIDMQGLYGLDGYISAIQLTIDDPNSTVMVKESLWSELGNHYWIHDWTERFQTFFQAIKTEKSMMFIILFFIIIVALFNLLSSLIMLLMIKKQDIGYLRTLGYTALDCQGLFLIYGFLVGFLACSLGVIFGLYLTHHVNSLLHVLEGLLGRSLVPASIYFVDYLPTEIRLSDLVSVVILTLLACLLTNWVPARMAARLDPAHLLRNAGA